MDDQTLADLLQCLDVPEHKKDPSRLGNVVWLLDNLRLRNSKAENYSEVMRALLKIAGTHNLLKKSKTRELEQHLIDLAAAGLESELKLPTGFVAEKVQVRDQASDFRLYPHQQTVLDSLKQTTRTLQVPAGAGKGTR